MVLLKKKDRNGVMQADSAGGATSSELETGTHRRRYQRSIRCIAKLAALVLWFGNISCLGSNTILAAVKQRLDMFMYGNAYMYLLRIRNHVSHMRVVAF